MSGLRAEKIAELGGKSGLLRKFVEDATRYVQRRTGVRPEQSLVILRSLRSAAGTNEAKTAAMIHALYPEFSEPQIREVLGAFAKQYIVHQVPGEGRDQNDLPYEFIHDQMITAIEEAPSPELIRVKDREARLKFWIERTATTFAPLPDKASLPKRLRHTFAAPIPLLEAVSLWRGASVEDKKVLRRNQLGWLKCYSTTVVALGVPTGIYYSYTNTWNYQIEIITNNVKLIPLESVGLEISGEYIKLLIWIGYTEQAFKTVKTIKNDRYHFFFLLIVADELVKTGKVREGADAFTKAIKTAESMKGDDYRFNALVNVAEALVNVGKASEAAGKVEEALKVVESIKGDIYRFRALASVAEALAKAGKVEEALKVVVSIKGDDYHLRALASVAEALAKAGKVEEALKVVESIKGDIYRFRALASVAEALAKAGKVEEALKVVESIKDDIYRLSALVSVAEALAKAGKVREGKDAFTKAIKTAESIKGDDYRFNTLVNVAEALVNVGKASEAADALAKALKAAESIKDDYSRFRALGSVAETLAKAGKVEEALKAAESIKDNIYRLSVLLSVAEALAKNKNTKQLSEIRQTALNTANGTAETVAQWTGFASKCSTLLGQEKRAQEEATGINDISYRLDAYNFLMREHLKRTNPKFREVWEAEQKEKEDNEN
jgi:tetratricopeptide (TPR) repeat protein